MQIYRLKIPEGLTVYTVCNLQKLKYILNLESNLRHGNWLIQKALLHTSLAFYIFVQPWFNHHCCQFPSEYKIQVFLLSVEDYRKQPWMAFFLHKVSQALGVITSSAALLKFSCTVSAAVCTHKAYICSCVGLSFCYNLSWLHPG